MRIELTEDKFYGGVRRTYYYIYITINPIHADKVHDLFFYMEIPSSRHYSNDMKGHLRLGFGVNVPDECITNLMHELFPYDLESIY
jgi:hypothetical protein